MNELLATDPARVGAYELLGRLGAGGMGTVFLGRAPGGRLVAVKVVHAGLAHDAEFRNRFRSEVARAREVPPFCTAEVLDADPEAPQPYLVVEYVDGPALSAEVAANGPLTPANLHAVAVGIATALTVIHQAGVIHRDLKPGNVLLAPGSPKVIDFGIARALVSTSQHTRTGQVVGTINYMAPERFTEEGDSLTPAADIFAWGCVVAYAGTGRTPFYGDSPPATAARILTQPPRLDGIPAGPLRRLVERALSVDPARRPTARDLLTGLIGDGEPTVRTERPRAFALLAGPIAVIVLALLAGAAVLYWPTKQPDAVVQESGPALIPPTTPRTQPASTQPVKEKPSATRPTTKPAPTKTTAPKPDDQPPLKAADAVTAGGYGPYFLYNLATGLCADLPGTGAGTPDGAVDQDVCHRTTADNQQFRFTPHGTDEAGNQLYQIQNTDDDFCLDVPGGGVVNPGERVTETHCYGEDNQDYRLQSRFTKAGRKYYWIVNAISDMCLEVYGEDDHTPGTALSLVGCSTSDDHEWALLK